MKKIISILIAIILCMGLFTGVASAEVAQPTNTLKTNGNGGKTDVGAWFVTYNSKVNWSNNFGSGYPIKYRTLMPDGSYGILDSSEADHIDYQLEQLAEAKIDFILFDITNGGLTSKISYGWNNGKNESVVNAKLTCERIAEWNDTHDWKIKYALAVGAYTEICKGLPVGIVTEYQAEAVYNDFFLNPVYGGDDHYQIDGKPLLIIHDWGHDVLELWDTHVGDRTYGDKFFVRNGQNGEKGTYGWYCAYGGSLVDDEVMLVNPGQNTAGPSKANAPRNNGELYKKCWEDVLTNTLPRIIMIGSFNDYNEQTAVFTADSSSCRDGIEEKWTDETGKINNSMYWDMTKEGIKLVRTVNGEIDGEFVSTWFDISTEDKTSTDSSSNTLILIVIIVTTVIVIAVIAVVLVIVLKGKKRK